MRRAVFLLVILFFLARFDLWQVDDASRLWGLPIGLTYHVIYTLATIGVLALLVRFAWPTDLDGGESAGAPPEGKVENGGKRA